MQCFNIGDVVFSWEDGCYNFDKKNFFEKFTMKSDCSAENKSVVRYYSEYYPLENYRNAKFIKHTLFFDIWQVGDRRLLIYPWATCRFAYGIFADELDSIQDVKCYFNPKMKNEIPLDASRFFSTAGMHSKLLWFGGVVLHASYINWNGQAILFTAPSQTGKSTQAGLWEQYEGAEIINGDRALVRQKEGVWHAYGYPSCGSSDICINKTLPLKAIVVLKQDNDNSIVELNMSEKIRSLVSGIQVFAWNVDEVQKSFELAEKIIAQVPVFLLKCRPDKQAVDVLKNYLEVISNDAI